ncbi:MAG: hypothetical protein ACREVL_09810 [Solimonas sp.]
MRPDTSGKLLRRSAIAAVIAAGAAPLAVPAAPGDPLGAVFTVADGGVGNIYGQPSVARDADGDMVVVWHSALGVRGQLLAPDGAPKGTAFIVDAVSGAGLSAVAMDSDGDFVVAWARADASGPGIHAQRYRADGTPQGAMLQVSEPFDARIGRPALGSAAVAMDADGDFAVAWSQGHYVQQGNTYACGYRIGLCTRIGGYSVRVRRYDRNGGDQAIQAVDATGAAEITLFGIPAQAGSTEDRVTLAMAPDGRFVVAWNRLAEVISLASGVYMRRYDADGRPELKRLVALQRDQAMPAVAMNAGGACAVIYRHERRTLGGYETALYMRQFPAGTGLGSAEIRVDDGGSGSGFGVWPSVAMDAAGDAVAAWAAGDGIRAQRYAAGGGALGINFVVGAAAPLGYVSFPSVAAQANGDFAIAWGVDNIEYPPGSVNGIYTTRIDARLYDGP